MSVGLALVEPIMVTAIMVQSVSRMASGVDGRIYMVLPADETWSDSVASL